MTFLTGVQDLHREAKLPGSPPAAVTGQTGRAADLVAWYAEAWNDIQRERDGKWKWLRRRFGMPTSVDDPHYLYTSGTDVALSVAIARFRRWDLDPNEPPLIHLSSAGFPTQTPMVPIDWQTFRSMYGIGGPNPLVDMGVTSGFPRHVTENSQGHLYIGPKPDGIYEIYGNYWRSNQVLAASGDVPELPTDYHMLIVYRAIVKYAYNVVSRELLARAQAEGAAIYDALVMNQAWSRFTFCVAGPLA